MKLEVGMYVRTKYGIAKIIKTDFINEYLDKPFLVVDRELEIGLIGGNDESLCDKKDIIGEASFNIRDLIEVGDYVNGHLVTKISKDGFIWLEGYDIYGTWNYVGFINEWRDNIKSIVTKEQFESMKYEVE